MTTKYLLRLFALGMWLAGIGLGFRSSYRVAMAEPRRQVNITFLGQDGYGFVGRDCRSDPAPDNIHLRVSGLGAADVSVGYEVDDPEGQGYWIWPCNNFNWWLEARPDGKGSIDLFVKPHRYAPDGTPYEVTVQLADGSALFGSVQGSAVGLSPIPPNLELAAAFLGQDGAGLVGADCRSDPMPDNIHIRLTGVETARQPVSYSVNDASGYGLWVWPCNHFNWWLAPRVSSAASVDLYLKPHRNAPEGAPYLIVVGYADGSSESTWVRGTAVSPGATAKDWPLAVEFRGQDGHAYVGADCRDGWVPDNIHFHVANVRPDVEVAQVTIGDPIGGRWVWPCNHFNWWLAPVDRAADQIELYAKPHRYAPTGTRYDITVTYADGTRARGSVAGTAVSPWSQSADR